MSSNDYQVQRSLSGSTSKVVTESGVIKDEEGVLRGIMVTATSSGTLKFVDGLEGASTVGSGTLTSAGACAPATHALATLTSTGASVAATHATGTLTVSGAVNFKDAVKASAYITSDETQPTAGKVVVVGSETYTFRAAGTTGSRFDVALGADTAATMVNLYKAIAGNEQVDTVHTSTYVITVTAKTAGTAGNSIAATEDDAHLDWDGSNTTLTGGLEAETVTIGTKVYRFKTQVEQANDVKIGSTSAISLANLKDAINATASTLGVTVGQGTVAHTQVVGYTSDATTCVVVARLPGASLNAVATTETCASAAFGGGTLVDGVTDAAATVTVGTTVYMQVDVLTETYGAAPIANQFLRGASEATMLDAFKAAINGTSVGTLCSTGTLARTDVIATTNADDSQVLQARVPGTTYNTLATTCTMANTAFGGTTMVDGVTTAAATITIGTRTYTAVTALTETSGAAAIADQIKWVTSEAVFLDNVKKAINCTGIAGTDYSTGTTPNLDVVATTNSNTQQVIDSLLLGSSQNAIATTTTLANYSWGAATLASGSGATGKILVNTFTPAALNNTQVFNLEFERGLSVVCGGTSISATVIYK